ERVRQLPKDRVAATLGAPRQEKVRRQPTGCGEKQREEDGRCGRRAGAGQGAEHAAADRRQRLRREERVWIDLREAGADELERGPLPIAARNRNGDGRRGPAQTCEAALPAARAPRLYGGRAGR